MPFFTIGLTKADFICIIEVSPCCDLGNTEPQSGFLLCGKRRRAEGAASAGSVGCGHCLSVAVASSFPEDVKFLFFLRLPEGGDSDVHNLGRAVSARRVPCGTDPVSA